jgi:hypothetical protein
MNEIKVGDTVKLRKPLGDYDVARRFVVYHVQNGFVAIEEFGVHRLYDRIDIKCLEVDPDAKPVPFVEPPTIPPNVIVTPQISE